MAGSTVDDTAGAIRAACETKAGHLSIEAEEDVQAWLRKPMTAEEKSLAEVADWGPAEDWSDWADEKG